MKYAGIIKIIIKSNKLPSCNPWMTHLLNIQQAIWNIFCNENGLNISEQQYYSASSSVRPTPCRRWRRDCCSSRQWVVSTPARWLTLPVLGHQINYILRVRRVFHKVTGDACRSQKVYREPTYSSKIIIFYSS